MKMNTLSALCLAGTMLTASSMAMAWESEDGAHSTSASVALGTDYVWRGYSQTDEEAAISGSFDYGHSSGLYAGVWASNVDFSGADLEIDVYAGFASEIGDTGIGYDVGILRYIYPDTNDLDWDEYYASLSYSFFSAGIAHTTEVYGSDDDATATYYSLGFDYNLPYDVALSAGVGYYDYEEDYADDQTDYRIGVSKEFIGFGFDLTYYGMDDNGEDANGDLADDRVVFTISKSM
ncbi:hypothetical protein A9Q78_10950 [Methylophaga sp. 41_12_T18]|nr:hypothetical protein A9Q78_10950 [Methylophaga sp. 41_12_T18]